MLDALNSGDSNAGEIAGILSTDVGLVTQIMKIVNSAYYGLPSPIREIKHAVAYLGLGEIKRITLTVAVMKRLVPTDSAEFERFWCHSFHTALSARVIVKKFGYSVNPEELYVAALLHDVGKLVYLKFFPEQYRELTQHCRDNSVSLIQAEDELNLPGHADFGAALCDRWKFAESVKNACMRHELRDLSAFNLGEPMDDDSVVVCVANVLSNLMLRNMPEGRKQMICAEAQKALDCDEARFLMLMGDLYELESETRRFLQDLEARA